MNGNRRDLHVLFVHKLYLPSHGGVEWLMHSIAQSLKSIGVDITVLTTLPYDKTQIPIIDEIDGVRVIRIPHKYLFLGCSKNPIDYPIFTIHDETSNFVKKLLMKIDIVHLFGSTPSYLMLDVIKNARRMNKPIIWQPIFIPHRLRFHKSIAKRTLVTIFDNLVIPLIAKNVSLVITLTESEAEFFRRIGIPAISIGECVIRISIDDFSKKVIRKYGLKPENYILTVGRLDWYKGYDLLLVLWRYLSKEFSNLKLVIVGSDWGFKRVIQRYIENRHLNNIVLLSNIPSIELHSLYKHCLYVVLLTRWETFHRIALEAWMHKKPIVALDIGSPVDHIRKGGGILIRDSIKDLARSLDLLKKLIIDRSYREMLGKQGYEIYNQNFSDYIYAKKIYEIYKYINSTLNNTKQNV